MAMIQLPSVVDWPDAVGGAANSMSSVTVDAAGEGIGLVFAAPRSGSIKKLGWRTAVVTTGGDILVQLETLSSGLPSGTLVAAGATATVTVANVDDNTNFLTTLTTPPTVTKGTSMALVVKAAAGFAGSLGLARGSTGPYPNGNFSGFPYSVVNAATWALSGYPFALTVCYDDGIGGDIYYPIQNVWPGPYATDSAFDSGDTPDEIGNIFTLPRTFRAVGLWCWGDFDADCTLKLYGPSTVSIAVVATDRGAVTGGVQYRYFAAGDEQVLLKDTQYRMTILPGASTISVGSVTVAAAAMLDQLGGSVCHQTERTDAGAWTETTTKRSISIGLLLDQVEAATLPAAADVQSDAADYGYTGSMLNPSYPTTAATNAAHLAADVVTLNNNLDEMIAANDSIKAAYVGVNNGTAAGGGSVIVIED